MAPGEPNGSSRGEEIGCREHRQADPGQVRISLGDIAFLLLALAVSHVWGVRCAPKI